MVRQYKIHLDLDSEQDKIYDVTNGKVRFYQPSNLGLDVSNSIWQSNGVGVMGTRSVTQPQIEFKLETFGDTVKENYELITNFVQDILSKKFVTLEYQTESFQVFADLALANVTKTEGYGFNGQFSESITFDIITKWYTYEELSLILIENGTVTAKSKIYGGQAPNGNYKYIENQAYTYYGETDIERLTRWDIATDVFSIVGKFVPQSGKSEFGVQFLDDIGNEYTAIVMKPEEKPDYIMVNTDVNDEFYQGWTGTIALNLFPVLDFQRYRTREIKKGQMIMVNLTEAQLRIKRKVDFI